MTGGNLALRPQNIPDRARDLTHAQLLGELSERISELRGHIDLRIDGQDRRHEAFDRKLDDQVRTLGDLSVDVATIQSELSALKEVRAAAPAQNAATRAWAEMPVWQRWSIYAASVAGFVTMLAGLAAAYREIASGVVALNQWLMTTH